MEINPFKPLIQHYEEFYEKMLSRKKTLTTLYLKLRLEIPTLKSKNSYKYLSDLPHVTQQAIGVDMNKGL